MALEDITNDCRYLVHPRHKGGLFYNIQAEEAFCYKTVALYVEGELKTFGDEEYKTRIEDGQVRVYKNGRL